MKWISAMYPLSQFQLYCDVLFFFNKLECKPILELNFVWLKCGWNVKTSVLFGWAGLGLEVAWGPAQWYVSRPHLVESAGGVYPVACSILVWGPVTPPPHSHANKYEPDLRVRAHKQTLPVCSLGECYQLSSGQAAICPPHRPSVQRKQFNHSYPWTHMSLRLKFWFPFVIIAHTSQFDLLLTSVF